MKIRSIITHPHVVPNLYDLRLHRVTLVPFWKVSHTKTMYAVLCQLHHRDTLFTLFTFRLKNNVCACMRRLSMWYSSKWRQGDAAETNCWIKLLFCFSLHTKSILVTSITNHWCHILTMSSLRFSGMWSARDKKGRKIWPCPKPRLQNLSSTILILAH